MAVPLEAQPELAASIPAVLFEGDYAESGRGRTHDVTPDGQRFLMVRTGNVPSIGTQQIRVVQNWVEELKRPVLAE